LFLNEKSLIDIEPEVTIFGDIHGQFSDMLGFLHTINYINNPGTRKLLFLGDYVDRGQNSLDVVFLLFCLKCCYPEDIFLIRGNHEIREMNLIHGFSAEIRRKGYGNTLWEQINVVFDCLPLGALIGDRVLCIHGGLSPHLKSLDDIRNIKRPVVKLEAGLFEHLLWSDPRAEEEGFHFNRSRGAGVFFGESQVADTCQELGLAYIVRAHQVVQKGFEWFANEQLLTLFSAPNYMGVMTNSAAILEIDKQLNVHYHFLTGITKLDNNLESSDEFVEILK